MRADAPANAREAGRFNGLTEKFAAVLKPIARDLSF